ncbi:hypothetical protein FF38_01913 [Lucilia cuprina]|uniref:DUF243 domain-containing protein n=1 Tax=Lucilia cuprina TaxID=7375 RepID=A0A0L0CQY1_LUCCU|nr:hypothetical protein CVS40_9031 [Lucilia cuprina]KNC34785.1 hypothetical protein FF38_01913 [Lucilia cuprina]
MRGFIIIICLAFAQAEKLGYNYGQSGSHNAFESRFRNRGNSASNPTTTPSISNGVGTGLDNGLSRYPADTVQSGPVETNYNKEFYSYSAPEEDFNDIAAAQRLAAAMRKNLRVVFIKAPENNGLTNAALQLAQQNAESKTAIYVLTKQTDIGSLANQLQNLQHNPESKPEVHFVKYRTPEDAVRAQQIIQHEYDALGGSSRVSNEGVAPVLDFSSKKVEITSNSNVGSIEGIAASLNAYLPPNSRH